MAGSSPHIKTKCGNCSRSLTKKDPTFNVSKQEGKFMVHKAYCLKCMQQHHKDNPVRDRRIR